jgi:hypothetical protein
MAAQRHQQQRREGERGGVDRHQRGGLDHREQQAGERGAEREPGVVEPNSPIAAARRSPSGVSAPRAVSAAGLNAAVPRPATNAPMTAASDARLRVGSEQAPGRGFE